jgi:phage tail sheath protein FI
MLGNIIYGNVDSSVAGFAITKDRSAFVDFPVLSVKSQPGVFVRRPKAGDISIQAYLSEFSTTAWFSVGVYLACVILALFAIMKQTHSGTKTWVQILAGALNITLR